MSAQGTVDQFRANKWGYSQANDGPGLCECARQSDRAYGGFCRRGATERVVKCRCPQCIEWLCPAMVIRKSTANASRHTPSTASAANTGEGRRW